MRFPAGAMLIVQRQPELDAHGDPIGGGAGGWADSHPIGPCDIPTSSTRSSALGDGRATDTVNVNAPADSDIRKTDRVKLPNGMVATITSDIERPVNPFTNWAPFIHFTLKVVV
ncbi:hypothetical protein [Rhodococcoides fascians]|uniref:hypothetical protein n=1 Tax=Rhodococcoides fascians TaxID=1828 RepID=UPI0012D36D4D|nr:hypothetical protein [Rhodococcus fascians]